MVKFCLNCEKYASFAEKYGDAPIYCNDHKPNNYINVIKNKCFEKDCTLKPSFNFPTEILGLYCSLHLLLIIINIYVNI